MIRRLQGVHLIVDEVNSKAKEAAASDYEPSLEPFSSVIEKLSSYYSKEYDRYRLDEIVIAAVLPTVRPFCLMSRQHEPYQIDSFAG